MQDAVEIEAALAGCPGVTASAVARYGSEPEEVRIAFTAVSDLSVTPAALREQLADRLRAELVPDWFVLLEELPLGPDGAVDWESLHEVAAQVLESPSGACSPLQEAVRAIWEEFLGREVADLDTAFIDLDGTSLIAVRIAAALQSAYGCAVPVRSVFEHPTVRMLAAHLETLLETLEDQPVLEELS